MSYRVGIDFGTTFTAAAVHRDGEQAAGVVPLGDGRAVVPSVVFVAVDGSFVMGDAAVRRAVTDPDRVVREVKRRVGDATPVLVAGEPFEAHLIAACFVRWVVDRVTERHGEPPAEIALTHPASWSGPTCSLMTRALAEQGLPSVRLVSEPAAAAIAYTASRHVAPGAAVGVYDLGGGTFDSAIVRQLNHGVFELIGTSQSIESLGGDHFDEAVFEQVRSTLEIDDTAAATLRRECTAAKEALSADTEVTIPVPGVDTGVRLVRAEFERLIAPAIATTVDALRTACESADVSTSDLSAVLLVGGSSRIPLVAEQVSAAFGRPVFLDPDPKAVVACGAVLALRPASPRAPTAPPSVAVPVFHARRAVTVGVVLAMCAGAILVTAGGLGTNLLPGGAAPVGLADPITSEDSQGTAERIPAGIPREGEKDPWTGQPYRATTPPGPARRGARPTDVSPATLIPTPTRGGDRDAAIGGAPPSGTPVPTRPGTPDPTVTGPGPIDPTETDPTGTGPTGEPTNTDPTDPGPTDGPTTTDPTDDPTVTDPTGTEPTDPGPTDPTDPEPTGATEDPPGAEEVT